MKSLKYAPIAIALFFCFGTHLMMSYDFYYGNLSYRRVFRTCLSFTGIYFILSLISLGFFILEPLKKLNEDIENKKDPNNWFWYIYISGWFVPCFAFLEFGVWDFVPNKVGRYFFDSTLIFFIFKGLLLIPAHIINKILPEEKKTSSINVFTFIEILIILFSIFLMWVLGEVGDIDL